MKAREIITEGVVRDYHMSDWKAHIKHMDSDLRDVASWMHTTLDDLVIKVDMEPIDPYMKQIKEMYGTYEEYPNDRYRTEKIMDQIEAGGKLHPIYVDLSHGDFVMEGRHRIVAFWLLGMKKIPVAYVYTKKTVQMLRDKGLWNYEH